MRHLTEDPLRVVEALRGAPLASPARRFLALAFDLALLVVPNFAVVTAAAWVTLRLQDPAAARALPVVYDHRAGHQAPPRALAAIAPMLVRTHAEGLPPEVEVAVHRGDLAGAAELLRPYRFEFMVAIGEGKEARELRAQTIRIRVADVIPKGVRALASYGLMGLYFGLLTAGRRGQTLGKRLFGIRVARLDGHRLSLLESVERFVGYLHIPGSLGVSLLDLWRDPNRRMAHDRVAHTAVLRTVRVTEKAPAPHPASEPAPAPPPPTTAPATMIADR